MIEDEDLPDVWVLFAEDGSIVGYEEVEKERRGEYVPRSDYVRRTLYVPELRKL